MNAKNEITVGAILRTLPKTAAASLTHSENDDHNYIERTITETAMQDCLVKFYGFERLDGWTVRDSALELLAGDQPSLHLTYTED